MRDFTLPPVANQYSQPVVVFHRQCKFHHMWRIALPWWWIDLPPVMTLNSVNATQRTLHEWALESSPPAPKFTTGGQLGLAHLLFQQKRQISSPHSQNITHPVKKKKKTPDEVLVINMLLACELYHQLFDAHSEFGGGRYCRK